MYADMLLHVYAYAGPVLVLAERESQSGVQGRVGEVAARLVQRTSHREAGREAMRLLQGSHTYIHTHTHIHTYIYMHTHI